MDKKNKNQFKYQDFVRYIQKLYNSGRLISQESWLSLSDLGLEMDRLNRKSHFLKKHAVLNNFLSYQVEDFIVLTDSYHKLLKVVIDLEDYLKGRSEEGDLAIKSDEDAIVRIDKVFEDIEKLKQDHTDYFTKELK